MPHFVEGLRKFLNTFQRIDRRLMDLQDVAWVFLYVGIIVISKIFLPFNDSSGSFGSK